MSAVASVPKRLTAADMRLGMSKRWAPPEYAIMWEVGEGTGAITTRYADAVIMSLWPSRGLELHGVEIKVSRSDWMREAKDPRKAEAVGKFCDRWWIHTTPDVIRDTSEVPPLWGVREFDGAKWKTVREAGLNPAPEPTTRKFLAALLRRADGDMRHSVTQAAHAMIAADREAYQKRIDEEVKWKVDSATRGHATLTASVAAFEEASGLKISDAFGQLDPKAIGQTVKAIHALGLDRHYAGIAGLRAAAHKALTTIDAALEESGFAVTEAPVYRDVARKAR